MPMLMVDGVPIAEIDTETAGFLKRLANERPGKLLAPVEAIASEPRTRDLYGLERAPLVVREDRQDCDISLALRFLLKRDRTERVS